MLKLYAALVDMCACFEYRLLCSLLVSVWANLLQSNPLPSPLHVFVHSDPARPDWVSRFGILVAALIAFGAALITLLVNTYAARRTQRDTQFYEALKRFADRDSPVLRASAAGLLAEMASGSEGLLARVTRRHPPYWTTAVNQLSLGLLFEQDRVVLNAIRQALYTILYIDFSTALQALKAVNETLQADFVISLAEFLASAGMRRLDGISEESLKPLTFKHLSNVNDDIWEHFIFGIPFMLSRVLRFAKHRVGDLDSLIQEFAERGLGARSSAVALQALAIESSGIAQSEAKSVTPDSRFQVNAYRLYMNVDLYAYVLRDLARSSRDRVRAGARRSVFLGDAWLFEADLRKVDLQRAFLSGARLQHADLRGTKLNGAEVSDAFMWKAQIDESTDLADVAWWTADFWTDVEMSQQQVDANILNTLSGRYPIPANAGVHASIASHFRSNDRD